MINLAGDLNCNEHIRRELEEANITLVEGAKAEHSEVPFSILGILGGKLTEEELETGKKLNVFTEDSLKDFTSFVFARRWYYWSVSGYIPLHIAEEMYADPIGKKDVRVSGHCGCPPPGDWASKHLICGMRTINFYHIDSQEGLNLFVNILKKYRLF